MTDSEKLDMLLAMVEKIVAVLDRFYPILERYERAFNASNVFQARRAMKG
jgi:hypothetical protein